MTLPLAEAVGPRGQVIATDLSDDMVEAIRAKAARLGLCQIEAFRADAEVLEDIPDAGTDLVTCALGLMYVAEPLKALTEARRILKPGGRAVVAVWGARKNCGWADILPIVDARVRSEVCALFFRLGTGATLAGEMAEAGFAEIQTTRLASYPQYSDADSAAHADYLRSVAPYRRPGGYEIPGEFVVCRGWKPAVAFLDMRGRQT